ncbi:uncharacterized protein [Amphiura filiformis]|uniref:uncharacterized protein n=1 Tax=Amphiura filiformis TaxID=82378 RepID=UPI003B22208B
MRGAGIYSDHQLVRNKIKLKRKQQPKVTRRKFDTSKLQQTTIRSKFKNELKNRFDVLQNYEDVEDSVEKKWQHFENAYKETAQKVLGYKKKGQKPWISKESWDLVEERIKLKRDIEQTTSSRIKQNLIKQNLIMEVKKSMRRDKREWADDLASRAEQAAGNGRMKELYDITKTLSNDKGRTSNAVKDKSGNILTEQSARRTRWREHFEEVLNRPLPTNPVSEELNDQVTVIEDISDKHISKAEIRTAIRKMKNGKSGGKDEITAELLKVDIDTTVDWHAGLFNTI